MVQLVGVSYRGSTPAAKVRYYGEILLTPSGPQQVLSKWEHFPVVLCLPGCCHSSGSLCSRENCLACEHSCTQSACREHPKPFLESNSYYWFQFVLALVSMGSLSLPGLPGFCFESWVTSSWGKGPRSIALTLWSGGVYSLRHLKLILHIKFESL